MFLLYITIWVVAIIIQYFISKQFESVAADKGYQGSRFFHLSFWLGLPGWLLVAALPDRGNNNEIVSQATPAPIAEPQGKEVFTWHSIDATTAIAVGETNIKCTNCHRVQFKGNKICSQCGAKFSKIETQE
jgi:hypothetical protein